jgi:2,4-dienoyl-CoA reductase-like NADH-dependent reductase (Old Yellow Enzyme family)/thioredoxin reductase
VSDQPFPNLFSPLRVGSRTVRNRVALTATTTNYGAGHRVTERWLNFLAERAKGGAGLIITEILAVDPAALASPSVITAYDPANEDGFKRVAAAVEGHGACLVGQLWHPGRQQLWSPVMSPKGISDQPDAYSWTVPHVMSADELAQVADAYVAAAARLQRCGFGGVELHGAHGYLLTQILSPWSNQRADQYGGTLDNRIRLVRDIAAGIRQACGSGFVLGLKMPGDEGVEGGIDPDEAARITAALAAARLFDYFTFSQGNFSLSLENHAPDMHFRRGHFLDIHRRLRPAAGGTPVMAVGRIATPTEAEAAIADGACDLVGMTRALIADADWPDKARRGRVDDIRPSTYDNFAWGEIHAGKPLAETHNPQLAQPGESGWRPARASAARRVVVVGAGPAGLQAACIAAERGHAVTLFGASRKVGGKLRDEAGLPGGEEYGHLVAWMERQLHHSGASQELGVNATAADVAALKPDHVIVATGSHQRRPDAFAGDGVSVRDWAQNRNGDGKARCAVLFDMDHSAGTYAAAVALAQASRRLVLLTPRTQIARQVNFCSAIGVHRRLYALDVEIIVAAEPVSRHDGALTWRNVFTGRTQDISDVDVFVWSTPRIADDALGQELRRASLDVRLVGDCMAPRNLICAIHEGEAAAMSI